ncbi:MAG: hypothetical protein HY558_00200 [Euryarchaeota archaeon]|nr:hypothetical protein [Euryarchaeota archaeon]
MGVLYDCWLHPPVCGPEWNPGRVWGVYFEAAVLLLWAVGLLFSLGVYVHLRLLSGGPGAAVRVFFEENAPVFRR